MNTLKVIAISILSCGLAGSADNKMTQPAYTDNQLVRPEGYREWVFVGSNLGMGYQEENSGATPREARFHNIYIQPEAYRAYVATGKFPDKTMLVMEVVSAATQVSINRQGKFGDRFLGVEVALKDETRFAEKWAYFNFIGPGGKPLERAKAFPKEACWSCHNQHAAVDNVFLQFYPVLRDARK